MDKTPPAWAIEAVMDLADKRIVSGNGEQAARIISAHAPDAEALAVALSNLIELAKFWQVDFEKLENNPEYKPEFTWETREAISELAAYRARFPKE